jgi:hypothetical protein
MDEPQIQGRSTNPFEGQDPNHATRQYPPHPASHPIYPRPLSRAPTLNAGGQLPRTTLHPPPLPTNSHVYERDSVDYLDSDIEDPYDDINEERRLPIASPVSSSVEYFAAGPVVGSANRVNVNVNGGASAALAEVMARKRDQQSAGVRYF